MKKLTVFVVSLHFLCSSIQVQAGRLGAPNMDVVLARFVRAEVAAHQCLVPVTAIEELFESNFDFVYAEYGRALAQQLPDVRSDEIRQRSARQVAKIKERAAARIAEFGCGDDEVMDWATAYAEFAKWKPKDGFPKLRPTTLPARLKDPQQLDGLYRMAGYVKNEKGWLNECGRPAQLSNVAVDPDADRTLELVIVSRDQACYGQAGPKNTVFTRGRDGKWARQLDARGLLQIGTDRTNGHLDLHFGGSGYCGDTVYSWQKGKYSTKCFAVDPSMAAQCGKSAGQVCKMKSE